MRYPKWMRSLFIYAGFGVGACAVNAGETQPSVPDEKLVVDMPQYVVQETRMLPPPKSWRYVRVPAQVLERAKSTVVVPGYEVLSNVSEKNTRIFVRELQLRQFVSAYMWPMLVALQPKRPMVVIFDETKQAALPLGESGDIVWTGDPIAPSDSRTADFSSGAFDSGAWLIETAGPSAREVINAIPVPGEITEEEQAATAVTRRESVSSEPPVFDDYRRQTLAPGYVIVTAREGMVSAQVNADQPLAFSDKPTEEQLAANLSAWIAVASLQNLPGGVPRWFDAGLHRLIELTDVTPTRITFARNILGSPTMRRVALSDVLLKTDAFTEEDKLTATAFVHYGLYGSAGKHANSFMRFTERLMKEGMSDELFRECFGKTVKQIDRELETYGRSFADYRSIETKGRLPDMPDFTVEKATQSLASRLLAEALITQGKPDRALDELRIAYWRGEREPEMLATLAMLEERLGSLDRARKISTALMTSPKPPVRVLPVEARIRYRAAIAAKPADAKLEVAETRQILSLVARAIREGQNSEEVWTFFSEVVLRSAGKPHESIAGYLADAAKSFPKNETIRQAAEFAGGKS